MRKHIATAKRLTYKAAGVDIALKEALVPLFRSIAAHTASKNVLGGIGGFGAMYKLDAIRAMRHPVLVSGTDSVGTKLKIAFATGRHDTVGIDCVAMCVNDIICHAARPLFFLDYIGIGRLKKGIAVEIVKGVARGCELAGASLVGGETCQAGDIYRPGEYDLAGCAVGIVERKDIPIPRRIRAGDLVIALEANGMHSNGFSLARKVLLERGRLKLGARIAELGCTLADELLRPTPIYAQIASELFGKFRIKGLANITGGGVPENLPRVLPEGMQAALRRGLWRVPPIFDLIRRIGKISQKEMDRTFNNGIGMVAIVAKSDGDEVRDYLKRRGYGGNIVGEIRRGRRGVVFA